MPGLAPAARNSRQRLDPHRLVGMRRLDQRLVAGERHIGAERRGKRCVGGRSGRRLGEDDVEADRLGAGLAQRLDQPRMQAARPRPLQADFGEGRFVDRDDDRAVGGDRRRRRCREIVERRAPRSASTATSARPPQCRDRDDDDEGDAAPAARPSAGAWLSGQAEPAGANRFKRRAARHQNLTFSDPTNDRPQPGTLGASSNSWSKRL